MMAVRGQIGARLRVAARAAGAAWSMLGVALLLVLGVDRVAACRAEHNRMRDAIAAAGADAYGNAPWIEDWWREFAAFLDTEAGTRWEPFAYWRSREFHGAYVNVDAAGHRVTWRPPRDASSPPRRVFVFGGSTAWGVGARDDGTIASRLAVRLAEAGLHAEVHNRAQMGYVSTQEVAALLRALQAGERPDVAIFLDGFNDVLAARALLRPGVSWNERKREDEFNLASRPGALLAALVADSGLVRLFRREAPAWLTPIPPGDAARLADEVLRAYATNVALVDQARQAFGYRPVFYWQPLLTSKRRRTRDEEDSAAVLVSAVPVFDRVAGRWVEAGLADNPRFHDISRLFADEPAALYVDICHYSEAANDRIAQRIAGDVAALLRDTTAAPPGTGAAP